MFYELIDVETANVIRTYETEADALAEVRALLRANGPAYAEALALGCEDKRGSGRLISERADLAERALAREQTERNRLSA